ncbi:putative DNA-binding transcriptional regulator YafY [Azomonas agilis]|uniref:Putative DNA-binding transcriptional regulator YafY n=1 Tax=Azomonas agilis TaxID=116849 RepID=A0A562J2T3_9GAMM|nr:WYL domain-containing protein [Azomonas agilis]TWH77124.1 putative DNA-binding transcriptional regulator YafY [Azomonas agilis]
MSKAAHDPLVFRLCQILVKLNQGEELDAKSLAEEFNISIRTAQRDLSERFGYLPLEKNGTRYRLDPACLGKIGLKDIERFASLAGVRGLFPSLSNDFLRDIFDNRIQSALLIKGQHYESLEGREELFRRLERAIVKRCCVSFVFCKTESRKKHYQNVEPYKMVNHRGVWYLAARDAGQLKTFGFSHIEQVQVLEQGFDFDPTVEKILIEEDGIWLGKDKVKVMIQVDKEAAIHFKRRKLINNQVIEKELEEGGLIISALIGHTKQVLPIVRYWIPHLRIISPEDIRSELELGLAAYLDK